MEGRIKNGVVWLDHCFSHLSTVCVCVCVCVHVNFLSLLFLDSPKYLKEFIVFPLATESPSSSKLSFVPSEKSLHL